MLVALQSEFAASPLSDARREPDHDWSPGPGHRSRPWKR